MQIIEAQQIEQNPIADFVSRATKRGLCGFRLSVRVGQALEQVDEYAASEPGVEGMIWRDAKANAEGFQDLVTAYVLQSFAADNTPGPSRSFSIVRTALPAHGTDRYNASSDAALRLALEQLDRAHKVIAGLVPATMVQLTQMIGALAGPIEQMSQTNAEALQELRTQRGASQDAERAMLRDAAREARIDKLVDMGIAMLPTVIEKFGKDEKGG